VYPAFLGFRKRAGDGTAAETNDCRGALWSRLGPGAGEVYAGNGPFVQSLAICVDLEAVVERICLPLRQILTVTSPEEVRNRAARRVARRLRQAQAAWRLQAFCRNQSGLSGELTPEDGTAGLVGGKESGRNVGFGSRGGQRTKRKRRSPSLGKSPTAGRGFFESVLEAVHVPTAALGPRGYHSSLAKP